MKRIISDLIYGRSSTSNGLIALAVISLIALGCACGDMDLGNIGKNADSGPADTNANRTTTVETSDDSLPSTAVIQALAKETTREFSKAIDSGDFSDIYESSSPDFQTTYTEAQMRDAFKVFTSQKKRVVPILNRAVDMEAQFSPEPYIRTEKGLSILVVNGKYATKPLPVNVEYEYVYRSDKWKMLKLIVKMQ